MRALHFGSDAEALIVIVDADDTPVHLMEHEQPGQADPSCRLCMLQRIAAETLERLGNRPYGHPLKIAFGTPAPAIEAWYLCGRDPYNTEVEWARRLQERTLTQSRNRLKIAVYGVDRPTLPQETEHAVRAATDLANNLSQLEQLFLGGFGTLVRMIRAW
jgi:hypothetical protein